jgi:outer membrane lipoprotein LolB
MRIFLIAAALLISACSTPPQQRSANLPQLPPVYHEDISLTGRLSVSYQQNGKAQALQGKFSWDQHKDTTHIALFSPLGQTIAQIAISPAMATLKQAGSPMRVAADINSLTLDALGWPMPVAGLRDWLQGYSRDARGIKPVSSAAFQSADWQINYVSWQDEPGAAKFPKRIDLRHASASAGMIGLKIVIDTWLPK